MIENQNISQPIARSWTINDFHEKVNQKVIRKFINSAIYVEKAVIEMPPQRKTSPLSVTDDSDDNELAYLPNRIMHSSKSTCNTTSQATAARKNTTNDIAKNALSCCSSSASYLRNCLNISKTYYKDVTYYTPESGYITNNQSSSRHSSVDKSDNSLESQITVKAREGCEPNNHLNNELRLSLTCLNTTRTDRTSTLDPKEKQEIVQNWIAKKELEKRRKYEQEAKLAKQKEEERKRLIEKERESFKKWLADKKKEDERKRLQKELEAQEVKLKEVEKEKRRVENEISFNLWLRKKEKDNLEKRITEKLALIRMYEEKHSRMEENERAYEEWLKNSKTRQKPIPMNKGLQSLCSSTSITYINPVPWHPNIDPY